MTTKATILRTIREHCIECMGGMQAEVERCTAPECKMFEYRMGKDPKPNAARAAHGKRSSMANPSKDGKNESKV